MSSGNWSKRLVIGGAALLLVALGFVLGTAVIRTTASSVTLIERPVVVFQQPDPITENERYFADIYARVSPSVVSISVSGTSEVQGAFQSGGTGFVIDNQGYIVTNAHVIEDADLIEVNFIDGTIVEGEVVGADFDSDVAVLRVNMPSDRLQPIPFGNSDELFIGETTLAIGSPFGQRWTLTTGIISALDRTISGLTNYSVGSVIQTDAAINPGNSGGPLLNLQGQVIGVNSQIRSETRSNSGIGFAIPSNLVNRVAQELIATGRVEYSYLGIEAGPGLNLTLMEALNLPNNLSGVVIARVREGGPADLGGLRGASRVRNVNGFDVPTQADIITAIDGVPVQDMSALVTYLAGNTRPGQTVTLTVWRDGEEIALTVTLTERPSR